MNKNKSKYMTITIKGEDLDCVKRAITVINNCIYEEDGIISEYNVKLLNALLGRIGQKDINLEKDL